MTLAQGKVDTVERAVSALSERDLEAYLSCCTEDIELHIKPMAAVGGVYVGRDAIQRFWTDFGDTSPDFDVEVDRVQPIGDDRVIAFMRLNATG